LAGIGLAAFYWVLDSVMHAFLFHEGTFIETTFPLAQPHVIWERSLVVLLLVVFSIFAQLIINKRKWAEEALSESESKYRTIFENTGTATVIIEEDTTISLANTEFEKLSGYSKEELEGKKSWTEFVVKDDLERMKEYHRQRRVRPDGAPRCYEFRFIDRGGNVKNILVDVAVIPGTGKSVASLLDITERKRMEEALRESEERYRALVQLGAQVGEAVVMLQDTEQDEGVQTFVSDEWLRLTGYSRDELLGKPFFDLVSPRDRAASLERHRKKMSGEALPGLYEMSIIKKDGTEVPIELTSAYTTYKGKKANVAYIRDITERKQAEAERRELERRAHLASRLATVGQMAAGIAHEINNPLTALVGFAQLLTARELPEDVMKDLRVISDSAKRVTDIVRRLLTFARQYEPERSRLNINELIKATLELRAYELKTGNIKVTTELDPELPETVADGGQLQQVFLNLIINAETEMISAHGGGNLLIKSETIDGTIRISFHDDGPGIPEENLERIFEPFFSTRKAGTGTGLGLSICHGIVTEHGGRIYAESEPGKGATFIVELPVVAEEKGANPAQMAAEEAERPVKAKILVVDDEPAIAQFLSRVLKQEGHEVKTIDNAEAALKLIERERYSLILLDIKLPGMGGVELYERLEKIAKSLTRRTIFITGDVLSRDTRKFLSRTRAAYISKPFDIERLKKEIGRRLSEP